MSSLCRDNQWDQAFADSVNFTADPVVATPDVTELMLNDDDEFVIIASDGLWYVATQPTSALISWRCLQQGIWHVVTSLSPAC